MNQTVKAEDMLNLLQEYFTEALGYVKDFGNDDPRAHMHMSWCIGMKEMCEALLGVPVNLQKDGRVTTGY